MDHSQPQIKALGEPGRRFIRPAPTATHTMLYLTAVGLFLTCSHDSSSPVSDSPGTVTDLQVVSTTDSSASLSFTEVDDGTGNPADYDIRYGLTPVLDLESAAVVLEGTCGPILLQGHQIGSQRACTILGLEPETEYDFGMVAFRGTPGADAVFGDLSNVVTATTLSTPVTPVDSVSVSPSTVTLRTVGASTQFTATAFDATGSVLTGVPFTWSSSDPGVATVNSDGLATAVDSGTTLISATTGFLSDSATLAVVPGVGAFRLNEPPGMTVLTERSFNALDEGWDTEFDGTPESIISDGNAPQSPPNVIQFAYSAGGSGGGPFGNVGSVFWSPQDTIYIYLAWRIDPNWQGHSSGVNKQFFLKTSNPVTSAGNQTIFVAKGSGSGGLRLQIAGQEHCCGEEFLSYEANVGNGTLNRGQWYELEFVFTANTPGVRNGTLEVWKDGTKTHNFTNFGPLKTGEGPGFPGLLASLIWGGIGDTVTQEMFIWWDHIYVSGK